MDHTILNSPTLFDLVRCITVALKINVHSANLNFLAIHDSFIVYSLINDFPMGNIAIMVIVLCFVIFAVTDDTNSTDLLVFICQQVLRFKSQQYKLLVAVGCRIVGVLTKLKILPDSSHEFNDRVKDDIRMLFTA